MSLLSRVLARERWSVLIVTPVTLFSWHRRMVRRHWTNPNAPEGAHVTDDIEAVIVRFATENPSWASAGSSKPWDSSRAPAHHHDMASVSPLPGFHHRRLLFSDRRHRLAAPAVRAVLHPGRLPPGLVGRCHRTPTGGWVTQQARNVASAMEDRGALPLHLIRDRDTKSSSPGPSTTCGVRLVPISSARRCGPRSRTRSPSAGSAPSGESASTTFSLSAAPTSNMSWLSTSVTTTGTGLTGDLDSPHPIPAPFAASPDR